MGSAMPGFHSQAAVLLLEMLDVDKALAAVAEGTPLTEDTYAFAAAATRKKVRAIILWGGQMFCSAGRRTSRAGVNSWRLLCWLPSSEVPSRAAPAPRVATPTGQC